MTLNSGNNGYETDSLERLSNMANSIPNEENVPNNDRFGPLKFKIEYNANKGIDAYFRSVDLYCKMFNIFNESDKILLSLYGLNSCDSSELVISILQPADYQNYENFKKVISCVLGHTKHFVEEQFYTIARNPNETIGCFFGRFVGLARKLFLKTEDDFPECMKNYIVTTFIYKLSLELRQKLLAEKSALNFSNLVERAQELESIFNIQPDEILPNEPTVTIPNSIANDIKNLTSTTDKKLIKLEAVIS